MGVSNVFWYGQWGSPQYKDFEAKTYPQPVGNIMATGVCIPFGYMTTEWAWRIPVLMQAGLPILQSVFIFFLPESPRW